jgi:hypothetical protein
MLYPPTIIYGTQIPDLRLRHRKGSQTYFCRKNENLHLSDDSFIDGTLQMGSLLRKLCLEHCVVHTKGEQPCPAFCASHMVGIESKGLATVQMKPLPDWEACAGVKRLLDICQTPEERAFLKAYLVDKYSDEATWRDGLVKQWNANWHRVPNYWQESSRKAKFTSMVWQTLRFPALIPQVWLNWLANSSAADLKILDENPSRVDFLAFWRGERHVIEIDGPSHYADFNGSGYKVDERAYARNLKIERSLRRDGWVVTRIGRIEVKDAMEEDFFGFMSLLGVLPFYPNSGYPEHVDPEMLGVPEIASAVAAITADDDIPF